MTQQPNQDPRVPRVVEILSTCSLTRIPYHRVAQMVIDYLDAENKTSQPKPHRGPGRPKKTEKDTTDDE